MTRTVALLGATGYTGRLTAAELERKGIPHRVGGRSKARLADVPSTRAFLSEMAYEDEGGSLTWSIL